MFCRGRGGGTAGHGVTSCCNVWMFMDCAVQQLPSESLVMTVARPVPCLPGATVSQGNRQDQDSRGPLSQ